MITTSVHESFKLVSRNGVNYKYIRGNSSKLTNLQDLRWDDLFIVNRNDENYKCEWKDVFGFTPSATWPNTASTGITTIGSSTDTFSDLVFSGDELIVGLARTDQWAMINDEYVWVSRDQGDTWIRMDGTFPHAGGSSECPGTDTWNYMYHSPNTSSVPLMIVGTGGRMKYNYIDFSGGPPYRKAAWGANWLEISISDVGAGTRSINQVVNSHKTSSNTWLYAADDGYVGVNTSGDGDTFTVTYPFGTTNAPDATCCEFGGGIWQGYQENLSPVSGNYWMVGASNGKIAYAAYVSGERPATSDWTEVNTGLTTVDDIAWGNGVWIAVGYSGSSLEVATSTDDGSNWTISTGLPTDMTSYGAASRLKFSTQARIFILMLKDRRHVIYSTDGSSWTVTYPQTGSITDGVYGIDLHWEVPVPGSQSIGNIDYSNTNYLKWMMCGKNRICEKSLPNLVSKVQSTDYLISDYFISGKGNTYKFTGQDLHDWLLYYEV